MNHRRILSGNNVNLLRFESAVPPPRQDRGSMSALRDRCGSVDGAQARLGRVPLGR